MGRGVKEGFATTDIDVFRHQRGPARETVIPHNRSAVGGACRQLGMSHRTIKGQEKVLGKKHPDSETSRSHQSSNASARDEKSRELGI
jgi:hypothetical protein